LDSANAIDLQVYGTEEVLFIYRPSKAHVVFKQWFRFTLYVSLCIVAFACFMVFMAFLREGLAVFAHPETYILPTFLPIVPFLLLGFAALIEGTQYLIRIDPTHIVFSSWWSVFRSTKQIDRPEKLELIQCQNGGWTFTGLPQWWAYFPARQHEIVWLREVLDDFENRPSREGGNLGGCVCVSRLDSRLRGNDGKAIRSVLQTMEYHGKPLERVLHPSQERASDAPPPTAGLFVRCSHCDAALPKENIWFEEAAGQCPECRRIFQIGDLKERTPPKRSHIEFQEDTTGLHLHQKPRHFNLLTLYLAGMLPFCFALYAIMSMQTGQWIQVPLDWEVLRIASGFLIFTAVLVLFTLWAFHTHRYVDFGRDTVQFRTRWLFWERRRSISRNELGAFCGKLMVEFFGGIHIRYGKNRSFYLLATPTERLYLVSRVNRWLWHNPPDLAGVPAHFVPPPSLSGLGENESEWRMFCPHCGRHFVGDEVDFPHRESPIYCPNCQQRFTLSTMSRFAVESVPGLDEETLFSLPEVPGLRSEQTGNKLTVEYTSPPPTWGKRIECFGAEIFVVLYLGVLFAAFAAFTFVAGDGGGCCGGPSGVPIAPLLMMVIMFAPMLPHILYGHLGNLDKYRSLYANWSIQIDRQHFTTHRHYAGESETVSYPRGEIRRLCRNECEDMVPSPLWGRFPSLLCNTGCGGIELVLRDGTVEPLPHLPRRFSNNRRDHEWNSRLVNDLNRYLVRR